MLKTLLAGTAIATLVTLGVHAQEAPADTETTPPAAIDNQAPTSEDPIVPETADDSGATTAPDAMSPDTMAEEPTLAPDAASPDTMAQEPAPDAAVPDTMAQDPAGIDTPPMQEGWTPVDLATISADTLIGSDITTYDQETVASVEDVLLTPDGSVENVVARFGGFLGFGETTVLLTLDEITVVRDADENVFVLTNLTPEGLKDRPEYTAPAG